GEDRRGVDRVRAEVDERPRDAQARAAQHQAGDPRAGRAGPFRGDVHHRGEAPRHEGGAGTMTPRSLGGTENGLTLLEVLISIVVLVLAVSTILPLFAVGSASHKRGIDQAQMAWLAPRVAARIQDRFFDTNPQPIKGFVRELE